MDNIELTQPGTYYLEPPLIMANTKTNFQDVSTSAGELFKQKIAARGAAFGDLFNRGLIDVAINCDDGPAIVAQNRGNTNHWITLVLQGVASNRDGIGSQVHLIAEDGQQQYATASPAGSYLSSSDSRVHFGLGMGVRVRSVEIRWPSGSVQKLSDPPSTEF